MLNRGTADCPGASPGSRGSREVCGAVDRALLPAAPGPRQVVMGAAIAGAGAAFTLARHGTPIRGRR
jgi:hypothetical protein